MAEPSFPPFPSCSFPLFHWPKSDHPHAAIARLIRAKLQKVSRGEVQRRPGCRPLTQRVEMHDERSARAAGIRRAGGPWIWILQHQGAATEGPRLLAAAWGIFWT